MARQGPWKLLTRHPSPGSSHEITECQGLATHFEANRRVPLNRVKVSRITSKTNETTSRSSPARGKNFSISHSKFNEIDPVPGILWVSIINLGSPRPQKLQKPWAIYNQETRKANRFRPTSVIGPTSKDVFGDQSTGIPDFFLTTVPGAFRPSTNN
ncbi:hypothetical protein HNY73_011517 [Argiope bruennichi]|uniref:Uncharacterized protein n=1 Tax=Argiope bruennichi TaxID=94029 RepID=A0A8T0F5B9_ARGBR|nr:hypothetical protein HNY73_011517 [Argiope bruennichi]